MVKLGGNFWSGLVCKGPGASKVVVTTLVDMKTSFYRASTTYRIGLAYHWTVTAHKNAG